eukprot:TRINITY_DN8618_c0_g1_i3.p1 TRINITY_DN8618_c0_g1~~TRINITY_DN8618_c0_g1_i3.p1  ORF type:complete len:258 (-),score=-31.97 TRINITY_DN8618_c0_g1_i3:169-942(-)
MYYFFMQTLNFIICYQNCITFVIICDVLFNKNYYELCFYFGITFIDAANNFYVNTAFYNLLLKLRIFCYYLCVFLHKLFRFHWLVFCWYHIIRLDSLLLLYTLICKYFCIQIFMYCTFVFSRKHFKCFYDTSNFCFVRQSNFIVVQISILHKYLILNKNMKYQYFIIFQLKKMTVDQNCIFSANKSFYYNIKYEFINVPKSESVYLIITLIIIFSTNYILIKPRFMKGSAELLYKRQYYIFKIFFMIYVGGQFKVDR